MAKNVNTLTTETTIADADKILFVLNSNGLGRLITKGNLYTELVGSNVVEADFDKLHNVTSTAAELNKLDTVTAVAADFELLSGLAAYGLTTTNLQYMTGSTGNIQTQLDTKATITSLSNRPYQYIVNEELGGADTTLKITNSDIFTQIGLSSSSYYIPANSVQVSVWKQASATSATEDKSAVTQITSAVIGATSTYQLTEINLSSLTVSTTYDIYVTFKVVAK